MCAMKQKKVLRTRARSLDPSPATISSFRVCRRRHLNYIPICRPEEAIEISAFACLGVRPAGRQAFHLSFGSACSKAGPSRSSVRPPNRMPDSTSSPRRAVDEASAG
jgi:hypothetical protein